MRVSVIIANWNYERFLEAAIRSVLDQTCPDVELIVVDDGSTDASRDIMEQFRGRATLLFKPNGGQASALNYAFPHSTGEIVTFLDADDLLLPDALAEVVSRWKPQFSKTHFPLEVIDERGGKLRTRIPRARLGVGNLEGEVLARGTYISPPSSGNVYSRRFLESVMPIPETDWIYADAYLICLAPLCGHIGAVDRPLGLYRRHLSSATSVTRADAGEIKRKLGLMLETDRQTRRVLEETTRRKGLELAVQAVDGHWLHLKTLLAMAKLESRNFGGVAGIAGRLLRAVWAAPEVPWINRIAFTLWAGLVALLPAAMATLLIQIAFSPGDRGYGVLVSRFR